MEEEFFLSSHRVGKKKELASCLYGSDHHHHYKKLSEFHVSKMYGDCQW